MPLFQGRLPFSVQRQLLQSGTAMKCHRNFLIVEGGVVSLEGTRRGGLSRLGGGGVWWPPPRKFSFQDVCRSDSYDF